MARTRANLPEGMQFRRPRRTEEAVPRVGSKSHDAGKSSFQVAKFHRAQQCGQVSAERAHGIAILRAWVNRRGQEDRGAGKRRIYRLREGGQPTCRFGRVHWIGMEIGLPSSATHENTTAASLTTALNNFASFPTRNHGRQISGRYNCQANVAALSSETIVSATPVRRRQATSGPVHTRCNCY